MMRGEHKIVFEAEAPVLKMGGSIRPTRYLAGIF